MYWIFSFIFSIETAIEWEEFIVTRNNDQVNYEKALHDEIKSFVIAVENYNDLSDQITKEKNACSQALIVIHNADFADYLYERIEDGIGLHENGD